MYLTITVSDARMLKHKHKQKNNAPANKFVEDFDIFLHFVYLHRFWGVCDRERGRRCAIFDKVSTGLKKATDNEDFEERVGIFEIFESASSNYKFVCVRVKITSRYCFKMFVELVTEN